MDALFNSLSRKKTYVFQFGNGSKLTAVFHEYRPDGTMLVAANHATYTLNPNWIVMAVES